MIVGETRNAYKMWVGKLGTKRQVWRSRRRWQYSVKGKGKGKLVSVPFLTVHHGVVAYWVVDL
jgi:hypothetical protein